MTICKFLEGTAPDNQDRLFSDILSFDDQKIESVHDLIQWLFLLDEPSRANLNAPVLSETDTHEIRQSETARQNLSDSSEWYLKFLSRNFHWIRLHDHNHLRISRVIKSLRLLHSDQKADEFRREVLNLVAQSEKEVGSIAKKYWEQA